MQPPYRYYLPDDDKPPLPEGWDQHVVWVPSLEREVSLGRQEARLYFG